MTAGRFVYYDEITEYMEKDFEEIARFAETTPGRVRSDTRQAATMMMYGGGAYGGRCAALASTISAQQAAELVRAGKSVIESFHAAGSALQEFINRNRPAIGRMLADVRPMPPAHGRKAWHAFLPVPRPSRPSPWLLGGKECHSRRRAGFRSRKRGNILARARR